MTAADDRAVLEAYDRWQAEHANDVVDLSVSAFLAAREAEDNARRVSEALERAAVYVHNWEQVESLSGDDAAAAMQAIFNILADDRPMIDDRRLSESTRRSILA